MKRLADGDDLALNGIMHRWKDRLVSFLQRSTGNHHVALDLAQETFVRLYQSRDRYKPDAAFATYLFRIAANLARNHARWRSRHPAVSLDAVTGLADRLRDPESGPDAQMEKDEAFARIERALATLPPELREALHLFTYEEMSQGEIARALGCSVKTVETRVYRARQMLRGLLGGGSRD